MSSTSIYSIPLAYVYRISDKLSGEFYIGSRYANVNLGLTPEQDLGIVYFTSGKLSSRFKCNPDQFDIQILFRSNEAVNQPYDVVYWYEQLLIQESIENESCLNEHYICPTKAKNIFSTVGRSGELNPLFGKTGNNHPRTGTHNSWGVDSKLKISKIHKGKITTPETLSKMSKSHSGSNNQMYNLVYAFDNIKLEFVKITTEEFHNSNGRYLGCRNSKIKQLLNI